MLATFGYYSFFSIFYTCEKIYQAINKSLQEKFETDLQYNTSAAFAETQLYADRLLRVLEYPTNDLDYGPEEEKKENEDDDETIGCS